MSGTVCRGMQRRRRSETISEFDSDPVMLAAGYSTVGSHGGKFRSNRYVQPFHKYQVSLCHALAQRLQGLILRVIVERLPGGGVGKL